MQQTKKNSEAADNSEHDYNLDKTEYNHHFSFIDATSSYDGDINSENINFRREKFQLQKQNKRLREQYDDIMIQCHKLSMQKEKAIKKVKNLQNELKQTELFYRRQIETIKNKLKNKPLNKSTCKQNNHNCDRESLNNLNKMQTQNKTTPNVLLPQSSNKTELLQLKKILKFIFDHAYFPQKQSYHNFWKRINQMHKQFQQILHKQGPMNTFQKASNIVQQNKRVPIPNECSQNGLAVGIKNLQHKLALLEQSPFIITSNPDQTMKQLDVLFLSLDTQLSAILRSTKM